MPPIAKWMGWMDKGDRLGLIEEVVQIQNQKTKKEKMKYRRRLKNGANPSAICLFVFILLGS